MFRRQAWERESQRVASLSLSSCLSAYLESRWQNIGSNVSISVYLSDLGFFGQGSSQSLKLPLKTVMRVNDLQGQYRFKYVIDSPRCEEEERASRKGSVVRQQAALK